MITTSLPRINRLRVFFCIILAGSLLISLIHRVIVVVRTCHELQAQVAVLEQKRDHLSFELQRTHELLGILQREYESLKQAEHTSTLVEHKQANMREQKPKPRACNVGQKRGIRR